MAITESAADKAARAARFTDALTRIARGESIPPAEMVPYLLGVHPVQRGRANALLAEAYAQAPTGGQMRQAWIHIQRAWMLSAFSVELFPQYVALALAVNDVRAVREAYKRLGMQAAAHGDLAAAIQYFNQWQDAYAVHLHEDKYEYDYDILGAVERMAEPHRSPRAVAEPLPGRKIRVAYLVNGLTVVGSVLVKINRSFAQWHDRSRFDITWFAPETEAEVMESANGQEHLRQFEHHRCRVVLAPSIGPVEQRLVALGALMRDAKPDVLVTSAALADFRHYFLTALRPAPRSIGFIQGPPPLFAAPSQDRGIAWTKHPLIDCPIDCSLVDLETALPERRDIPAADRRTLEVPEDACLLASAGRPNKFQEADFWKAILDILDHHPRAHYVALGVEESQVAFLPALLTPRLESRIRFVPWQGERDYLSHLCLADILVDTYPAGGGVVLVDALSLGIPVVSFENDYTGLFDQSAWSLGQEVLGSQDLVAPRGDFARWKTILSRLIDDQPHRRETAERGQAHVRRTYGNPERMVRRCEDVYLKVLQGR